MVQINPAQIADADTAPKIIQPREHRAQVSLWQDLCVNDLDGLEAVESPERIKQIFAEIFKIEDAGSNLKSDILLDLYFYTLKFSRDNDFSKEQTSAFFSMIKRTHEICTETPFANVDQCFSHFREMLLCHSVKRPPYSIDLYSAEEVKKITEYVINTYFRHYKMYKYVFTPLVRLDLSIQYTGMPVTPPSSEVGDQDAEQNVEEQPEETTVEVEESSEKPDETEESDEPNAAKELRAMIKSHLEDEIKKLRLSVDDKMKQSEEVLTKKLATVEGAKTPAGKSRGGSGKGKKK
ncbi:cilia- and flagella-associated protein 119-like [Tubulanus polymorphus]|uniref:cilia- and flagella-associated protein 119-like n=1 Tax=Tubulanus polymorphus TaxID=672921 RepID=UPI003DA433A9